jgi:Fe-S-cluster containining protein
MSASEPFDQPVEAVFQQQQAATIRALLPRREGAAVLGLARQAQRHLSARIDALPSRAQHACAPGCSFCCYLPVDVLAPEAFRIAAHLKRQCSPAELAELVFRLGAHRQPHAAARPCVFLAQGRCSIYAVRPLVCRGYNSLSQERCEAYFHDASVDLRESKDHVAGSLAEAVEEGLITGLTALGLDAQWYELPSAVLRALEIPQGPARWARSEAVFEGCDQLSQWEC